MKNKLLSVNNLRKIFHTEQDDVLALENINFDVYDNEFISIVGPSGCGKSTILSILIGLEIPSDGNVEVLENISVGYMLQSDCLFEWLTIFDNCLLGLEITNKLTDENVRYIEQLLKTYGLDEFKNKYPSNLSGGMRQRVLRILYTHK